MAPVTGTLELKARDELGDQADIVLVDGALPVDGPVTDTQLRATPVSVLDAICTPTVAATTAAVTDQVVVTPSAGLSLRLVGYGVQLAPTAPVPQDVTVKIGAVTVWRGFFQPSQPWAEGRIFEGGPDEAITVTTTTSGETVFNFRTQEF